MKLLVYFYWFDIIFLFFIAQTLSLSGEDLIEQQKREQELENYQSEQKYVLSRIYNFDFLCFS